MFLPSREQEMKPPGLSRGRWLAALACLGLLYLAGLGGLEMHPAFGDGPSIYVVSAQKSLAHGTGYRMVNYPQCAARAALSDRLPTAAFHHLSRLAVRSLETFRRAFDRSRRSVVLGGRGRRFLARSLSAPVAVLSAIAMGVSPLCLK